MKANFLLRKLVNYVTANNCPVQECSRCNVASWYSMQQAQVGVDAVYASSAEELCEMEPRSKTSSSGTINSAQQKVRHLVCLYLRNLEQRPILTKAITSAILAGAGDVISQWIVRSGKGDKFSWRSTAAFAAFGMVVTGPMTHYLYQFLEAVVPKRSQLSSLRKVILERLLFAPPYLLALFYTVAILEGKSRTEAWQSVKSVYWSALVKNWIIWGIAQYINMSYVPFKYRVLFANLVSLIWNIYSALARR